MSVEEKKNPEPDAVEKPTYPIFGGHEGEPPPMVPTRAKNGEIRWIPDPKHRP